MTKYYSTKYVLQYEDFTEVGVRVMRGKWYNEDDLVCLAVEPEGTIDPYIPAVTDGPADNWSPAEGGTVDNLKILIESRKPSDLIKVDELNALISGLRIIKRKSMEDQELETLNKSIEELISLKDQAKCFNVSDLIKD